MDKIKLAITGLLGALTAFWGWFGWLLVAWILLMTVDIFTGMAAARRNGEWASSVARDGLWHKAGCVSAVTAAGVLDLVAGLLLRSLPADALPFSYTVLLCPLAVVWYLLTEMGSILENAGAMGAPIPGWLRKAIGELRDKLEDRK